MSASRKAVPDLGRCIRAGGALALILGLCGCYPDSLQSAEETDLVATVRNPDTDFQTNKTFALPDRVVDLGAPFDLSDDESSVFPVHRRSDLILKQVRDNLKAAGYVEETDPENNPPDVVVLVGTAVVDWTAYTTYDWWSYWGWYPGWGYYPGYGPGWGVYYPPTVVVSTFEIGTLVIDMVDGQQRDDTNKEVRSQWVALVNGLLSDDTVDVDNRIKRTIDQAFEQSPYLAIGGTE